MTSCKKGKAILEFFKQLTSTYTSSVKTQVVFSQELLLRVLSNFLFTEMIRFLVYGMKSERKMMIFDGAKLKLVKKIKLA